MKTLVVYDNRGIIYYSASGDALEPQGLQFLWVEVPEGKFVSCVDVSGEEHVAVLADLPKTETQLLAEKIAELEQRNAELEDALCELSTLV